jgi:N-acetyl-1-D-myo-inositol-2-amino-2-deoxy-alpha-D-glucopyranoside deacetylase
MEQERRLLAVFAHPDDESFGCGGTLARCAARGVQVYLVCATRGEVGEIRDPALATKETLGQVREGELREACRVLGLRPPVFLGYRDSGMVGTPENGDPACLHQADGARVAAQVLGLLRELRPQAVLTFDAQGGYGHPDHIAVHRHTTAAFTTYQREAPGARLYYTAMPRSRLRAMAANAPPESPFRNMDPEKYGVPDEAISTQIDVSEYREAKLAAIACHRTQVRPEGGGPFARASAEERQRWLSTEHFLRALPPWTGGPREPDLFP